MPNSKHVIKKVLITAVIIILVYGVSIWRLPQVIAATANQTINSGAPHYHQMPNIIGSVNAVRNMHAFIKDDQKMTFKQASNIAAKQIPNGTVIGGHLGVVQGYLVYVFYVGDIQNKVSYLTIVDPGNGHVLYNNVLAYLTITDAGAPSHVIDI